MIVVVVVGYDGVVSVGSCGGVICVVGVSVVGGVVVGVVVVVMGCRDYRCCGCRTHP